MSYTSPEIRAAFLDTARVALSLVANERVAESWDRPSELAEWNVSGLAGHLARATTSVDAYLDRSESVSRPPTTPAKYYSSILEPQPDLSSELHQAIRRRGDETAAGGHGDLVEILGRAIDKLTDRLAAEPEDRLVEVYDGFVLTLDDYLRTRLVELAFHIDDLALSVGTQTPHLPPASTDIAIDVCVDVAREHHGDLPVLLAMGRRERDQVGALHVF